MGIKFTENKIIKHQIVNLKVGIQIDSKLNFPLCIYNAKPNLTIIRKTTKLVVKNVKLL